MAPPHSTRELNRRPAAYIRVETSVSKIVMQRRHPGLFPSIFFVDGCPIFPMSGWHRVVLLPWSTKEETLSVATSDFWLTIYSRDFEGVVFVMAFYADVRAHRVRRSRVERGEHRVLGDHGAPSARVVIENAIVGTRQSTLR